MTEILIFGGKIFVLLIFLLLGLVVLLLFLTKAQQKSELEIKSLHTNYLNSEWIMGLTTLGEKKALKELKKKFQTQTKAFFNPPEGQKRLFVLDFDGDLKASDLESFQKEVTAVLLSATPQRDEVVLRLESPGGLVHAYGLAASQVVRLKDAGLKVTICIDKIAASGGYLMAAVGDEILAAPFAIVGSIGVLAQMPNLHRLLKKFDIDYKEYTSGEYKRTVTPLGEITPQGEKKLVEQLSETHLLFKDFVKKYRPQLDLDRVGTGEYWYGASAKELLLIDQIQTSEGYLLHRFRTESLPIYQVTFHRKETLRKRLSEAMGRAVVRLLGQLSHSWLLLGRK